MADLVSIDYMIRNRKFPENTTKNQQKNLERMARFFTINKDDQLIRVMKNGGIRICVLDDKTKDEIFAEIHDPSLPRHVGKNKTYEIIVAKYYWYGISGFIIEKTKSCAVCQSMMKKAVIPKLRRIITTEPWEYIGIDLMGPLTETFTGHKYILIVLDIYSRWVEAFPLCNKNAVEVTKYLAILLCRYGAPKRIFCDQGHDFVNDLNTSLLEIFQVGNLVSSRIHDVVKRISQNLQKILLSVVNEHQINWDEFIEPSLYTFRTASTESTRLTPFEAFLRRKPLPFHEAGDTWDEGSQNVVEEWSDTHNQEHDFPFEYCESPPAAEGVTICSAPDIQKYQVVKTERCLSPSPLQEMTVFTGIDNDQCNVKSEISIAQRTVEEVIVYSDTNSQEISGTPLEEIAVYTITDPDEGSSQPTGEVSIYSTSEAQDITTTVVEEV